MYLFLPLQLGESPVLVELEGGAEEDEGEGEGGVEGQGEVGGGLGLVGDAEGVEEVLAGDQHGALGVG